MVFGSFTRLIECPYNINFLLAGAKFIGFVIKRLSHPKEGMGKEKEGKVQFFSEKTGKFYQLLSTRTVPALRINAVPMHRFVKVDPREHAQRIVDAANPKGKVLDICTGLGYTAIRAAEMKGVEEVVTIEKDSEVLSLCKANAASRQLFKNPKIRVIEGDATEKIREFTAEGFDTIVHDPPTFVAGPELYRPEFYAELFRALKKGGTLWHYTPEPGKASLRKSGLPERIMKNLCKAGFAGMRRDAHSTGVVCRKP